MSEIPSGEADRRIMSNAGRCDICGETVDMRDADDTLSLVEYGVFDEDLKEKHDLTDQDAIDAVADTMERVADSAAGLELAKVIREEGEIRVHGSCLDDTNYSVLETELPADG